METWLTHTTKSRARRTELGLSLAYDIVKAHGGEIKVESKERRNKIYYSIARLIDNHLSR